MPTNKKNLRVEIHKIKSTNRYYKLLDEFCFKSKNLYNFANYHIKQRLSNGEGYLNYNKMDKLLKTEGLCLDYRRMPSSHSAQQTLRLLDKNWVSFFKSVKDYGKNPDKYHGKPKPPKYLKKATGRFPIILTTNNCKLKEGFVKFPKTFNGFLVKTKVNNVQMVRILPRNKSVIVEVVYKIDIAEKKEDNGRYFSIDVGLDNLLTITNNIGETPMIINGKGLKSTNKYYNKEVAHYKGIAKSMNGLYNTKRIDRITNKRNNKINDYIHKASKLVVDLALELDISTIVIGNNKDWKRESRMSKKVNQSFVGIPHQELINKINYKAETMGINVVLTEESYTSGTSFLDGELPIKDNYNKSRRKHRGLFVSNTGIKINADVNGSYQILKKVFPKAFVNGVEGVGLHPIVVNV